MKYFIIAILLGASNAIQKNDHHHHSSLVDNKYNHEKNAREAVHGYKYRSERESRSRSNSPLRRRSKSYQSDDEESDSYEKDPLLRQIHELDTKLRLKYGNKRHYYGRSKSPKLGSPYDRSDKKVKSADEIAGGPKKAKKHHKKGKKSKDDSDSDDYDSDDYDRFEEDYRRERRPRHHKFGRDSHDRVIQRAIDALDRGRPEHHPSYYTDSKYRDEEFYDFGHKKQKEEKGEGKESGLANKIDTAVKKEVGESLQLLEKKVDAVDAQLDHALKK